ADCFLDRFASPCRARLSRPFPVSPCACTSIASCPPKSQELLCVPDVGNSVSSLWPPKRICSAPERRPISDPSRSKTDARTGQRCLYCNSKRTILLAGASLIVVGQEGSAPGARHPAERP